ncbi:calcium-binding protein [Yoonia sp. R2331]|uniref:calcium-binding protein n=1 Tax=Yoonia sp. R2331 TaxID=3237238 RepID=UPI0034E4FD57
MPFFNIGTDADGFTIWRMGAADETSFYLNGGEDFFKGTNAGWLGFLDAGNGRNEVTLQSNVFTLKLEGGNDVLKILSGTNVESAFMGNGNDRVEMFGGIAGYVSLGAGRDVLVMRNNSSALTVGMEDGDDRVTLNNSLISNLNGFDGDYVIKLFNGSLIEHTILGGGSNDLTLRNSEMHWLQSYGDVTMSMEGNSSVLAIELAGGSNVISTTGPSWIGTLVSHGDLTLDTDSYGVNTLKLWGGSGINNAITNGTGDMESIEIWAIQGYHNISSEGYVRSVSVRDDNAVDMTYGSGGGGSFHSTSSGTVNIVTTTGVVDQIWLGSGNDSVEIGSAGAGDIGTGSGDDVVINHGYTDTLDVADGNDEIYNYGFIRYVHMWNGADYYEGSDDQDVVESGHGNDTVNGNLGDDIIWGRAGADDIRGGGDDDILQGGNGADEFFFAEGDGSDVIRDFDVGTDTIVFEGGTIVFGDLAFAEDARGVLVDYGTGEIYLRGVTELEIDDTNNFDFI